MRVAIDTREWERAIKALGGKNAMKAGVRAVNRTAKNAKTAMVRVVAKDLALQQKAIRDEIVVSSAKTSGPPAAKLYATTKKIPLINFKAKQTKRNGVTYRLPTGAGRLRNAFIATVRGKSGATGNHTGVFERNTTIRSRKGAGRGAPALGIHEKFGPSVAQSFTTNQKVAEDRAIEMLSTNFANEVKFMLSQAAKA